MKIFSNSSLNSLIEIEKRMKRIENILIKFQQIKFNMSRVSLSTKKLIFIKKELIKVREMILLCMENKISATLVDELILQLQVIECILVYLEKRNSL
ncbi:hypothetical protein PDQ79_33340 [Bacillus cereus]|nr:hypothetical protein [Bacillus cereus]